MVAALGIVLVGFSADIIDYRNRTGWRPYDINALYYNRTTDDNLYYKTVLLGRPTNIDFTSFISTLIAGIICVVVGIVVGSLVISHRYSLLKLQLGDTKVRYI